MSPSDSTIVLGFNALSGGYFWHQLHEFMGRHKNANYWTSSENDSTKARLFIIGYGNYNYQEDKLSAASVRCLKNKD
jgi:uncharacterized protein (TIGR02145 family)